MKHDQHDHDADKFNVAYYQLKPKWTDLLNLYEPTPGQIGSFLRSHPSEDPDEFAVRAQSACQINAIKVIVEFYKSMLFSGDPRITSTKYQTQVQAIEKKATLQGDSLKDFLADNVFPMGALYGVVDVFCDVPNIMAVSLADQIAKGVMPYLFTIQPLNRVRWSMEDDGTYSFYQSEDIIDTEIASQFDLRDRTQYQQWTPDVMRLVSKNGQVLAEVPNPFGLIPAVPFIPLNSLRFADDALGVSLVDEQLDLQRELLNTLSLIADFHRSINFAMFTVTQDVDDGEEPAQEGELDEMGNNRAMMLKGKGSRAEFVSPSAEGVRSMYEYVDRLVTWMFQLALVPMSASDIKTHTSANTIRSNLSQLYNRLTKYSRSLEKATKRIIELSLKVQGIDPADAGVQVQWNTNFSYESFANAIEQIAAFRDAVGDMSETAVKQLVIKMVQGELYSSGKMDTIESEINAWKQQPPPAAQPDQGVFQNTINAMKNANLGVSAANKATDPNEGN